MAILSVLFENGLWIAVPLFCLAAALLGYFIVNAIRAVEQAHILSIPLLERQEIEFVDTGRIILCTEGPRFSRRFAKLTYELNTVEGTGVKGRPILFRLTTSGVSKVRMALRRYEIPRPGRYVLRIRGLQAGQGADPEHRIVFMRPHLARSVAGVIGIVLAAILLIASVVLFLMRLTS